MPKGGYYVYPVDNPFPRPAQVQFTRTHFNTEEWVKIVPPLGPGPSSHRLNKDYTPTYFRDPRACTVADI